MLSMNHPLSSDVAKGRASKTPGPLSTLNGRSTSRSSDDESARTAAADVRSRVAMWSTLVVIAATSTDRETKSVMLAP
jgi:hypothetical protein